MSPTWLERHQTRSGEGRGEFMGFSLQWSSSSANVLFLSRHPGISPSSQLAVRSGIWQLVCFRQKRRRAGKERTFGLWPSLRAFFLFRVLMVSV